MFSTYSNYALRDDFSPIINGSPGLSSGGIHHPSTCQEYRGVPRTSDTIYVASRHWPDGGCNTHEESQEVDLSHMVNRGNCSKSSGHEERGSHETDDSLWGGWEKCLGKSLPCYMIMYIITLCIYQSHRDMSQLMESVTEAAALQLASPISVEPCSSVAGFCGCSGSVQPRRLVEEFARTLLSPRMFFFFIYI